MKLSFFSVFILFLFSTHARLLAQDTLKLNNPSFEDSPRHSKVPEGWINCGFKGESPPDVGPTDFFKAKTQASHGQTHLIMVTRDVGSWERIGNLLSSPMQAGQCYTFSLDLARSPVYLSVSRASDMAINFNVPLRLRIWGANAAGELQELLAVSEPVEQEDWQQYHFDLCPLYNHPMLVLEAMYVAGTERPYAGNIMLDNCADLVVNTNVQRDELRLKAWNAEAIPSVKTAINTVASAKSPVLADTILLKQCMDDIRQGRVDIGLSELAAYAKDFTELPWVIVLEEEILLNNKQKIRILRKRIKAMGLQPYLSVKIARKLPQRFRYLVEGLGWKA